jgi:DNA-binding LacI/PurR family transcriptional regulator
VTSSDVARLAGVSRATVSLILNEQTARFSPDTVMRVRACAAALGYVRSAAGRALVRGHSDFVVLVVPYTTFPKLQEVVEALSADFDELGFSAVVHFNVPAADTPAAHVPVADVPVVGSTVVGSTVVNSTVVNSTVVNSTVVNSTAPSRLHRLVKALRPAGVVDLGGLSAQDRAFLDGAGCPVFPRSGSDYSDYNSCIGLLQAEHLHARGYDRLAYAYLSDSRDDPFGWGREEAVTRFCAARGLKPPAVTRVPLAPEGADRALGQLIAEQGRPVGIACYNDEVALALVFAAQRLGLAVPGGVAVVGSESGTVAQAVSPRLTTVVNDVSAVLRHVRQALAQAYADMAPPEPIPTPEEAYTLLPGETS